PGYKAWREDNRGAMTRGSLVISLVERPQGPPNCKVALATSTPRWTIALEDILSLVKTSSGRASPAQATVRVKLKSHSWIRLPARFTPQGRTRPHSWRGDGSG